MKHSAYLEGRAVIARKAFSDPATAQEYRESIFDNAEIADTGYGVRERVFANIYDLLLASRVIGDDQRGEYRLYRGHYDSQWDLTPSFYRASPARTEQLIDVVHQGQLAYLKKKYPKVDFDSLSWLQQEAVIQHYLSGTRLLDFTRSMTVAAYFATHSERQGESPDCGAIYRISPKDVRDELELATVEAPELPAAFLRIHRQSGVFLQTDYRKLMNEPGLFERWAFYHTQAGLEFECEVLGVTKALLLPEEVAG